MAPVVGSVSVLVKSPFRTEPTKVQCTLSTIEISPGSHLLIPGVTWAEYEGLLKELGADRRVPRINYCDGILEIMAPLPAHERPHRIIADIVKTLLDAEDRPWEDFGSTTFKQPQRVGLEPDTCFYIQNAEWVRSRLRLDMAIDPPPDLAIESDVTSQTTLDTYATLQVPEVWIYSEGILRLYRLRSDRYDSTPQSGIFPALPIPLLIPQLVQSALATGTSTMLRKLRRDLQTGTLGSDSLS